MLACRSSTLASLPLEPYGFEAGAVIQAPTWVPRVCKAMAFGRSLEVLGNSVTYFLGGLGLGV